MADLLNLAKPRSGFVAPYKWDTSRVCMIKHEHGGFLRANPKNHEECSSKGGQTDWSKWTIHLHENAKIIQIQNKKTFKYLEIDKKGRSISVSNDGGLSSKFIRHCSMPLVQPSSPSASASGSASSATSSPSDGVAVMNGGDPHPDRNGNASDSASKTKETQNDDDLKSSAEHKEDLLNDEESGSPKGSLFMGNGSERDFAVKLESVRCRGLFLAVHPNNGVYIGSEAQSDDNLLYFLVRGKSDEGLFKRPYSLKQQNTIIIHHAFGGSIRVHPDNEKAVDHQGDKDLLSRWEALPDIGTAAAHSQNDDDKKSNPQTTV